MTTEKGTRAEAVEAREAIDKAAGIGRAYVEAASAAALAGLKTAFDLQGDAIVAGRAVADATIEASKHFADEWAQAVRDGQAAAAKYAEASAKLAVSALDTR